MVQVREGRFQLCKLPRRINEEPHSKTWNDNPTERVWKQLKIKLIVDAQLFHSNAGRPTQVLCKNVDKYKAFTHDINTIDNRLGRYSA
jgi:hypothetical protein